MAAFPLIKFAAKVINHISTPLSLRAKAYAKESQFFRNYICIPPAQLYHAFEVRLKLWSHKLGKPVEIPPLKESAAVELGAGLVGDATIFLVGSSIFLFEYFRRAHNKNIAEMEEAAKMSLMISDLKALYRKTAEQRAVIDELVRIVQEHHPGAKYNPEPVDPDEFLPNHLKPLPETQEEK